MQNRSLFIAFTLLSLTCRAQTVYFHQDFSQTSSLVNPEPDTGQFSHIILTAPALSYHKFHKGYMELVRTRQDSATGGIIRAMRATPFSPNPETLIIRIKLSVESIAEAVQNAVYFYVGEDFNPVNNSFPGNALMFAKCGISFGDGSFFIKDLETQLSSKACPLKVPVALTWVLNNSKAPLPYRVTEPGMEKLAQPGTYDLWVNDEPVHLGSPAYPGNSAYSATKLSNFEIRFRNGVGNIRLDEVLIHDGKVKRPADDMIVFPNPVDQRKITLAGNRVDSGSLRLTDMSRREWPVRVTARSPGKLTLAPFRELVPGIYLLQFQDQGGVQKCIRLLID